MPLFKLLTGALFFALLVVPVTSAEDADAVREKGIAALKESQTNPRAIVEAARLFVKAAQLYNAAGNEEKNVEMNSFLYWCKKKMTMEDIDAFTKGGEAAVSSKLADVEKNAPAVDDAQKWFDRADAFARKNPNEHLLIAIRFYEVADRFKGSDASLKAQDRSLKEQLQDKSAAPKIALPPVAIKVPETVAAIGGNRPIPKADDGKKAEKEIKELFKDDYANADAPGRLALVAKLLQQADENKGDAATEYVLLHEARDLAVLAGDAKIATDAQAKLRDEFVMDFAAMLLDLKRLEPSAKSAESAAAMATLYALCADDAVNVENYQQAVRFNSRAEDLLPLIKDAALKARLKTEIPRVLALNKDSVPAIAALKILTTKPDDPEANLTAGKFALQCGQFERAFALLAKGKDAGLSSLAKSELTPPTDAAEQVKIGDGWFDRAEKEFNAIIKTRMQERAATWYGNALPALNGLAKVRLEGRLKNLPHVASTIAGSTTTPAQTAAPSNAEPSSKLPKLSVVKVTHGLDEMVKDDTDYWRKRFDGNPYPFLYGGGTKGDPAPGKKKIVTAQLLVDGVPQTFSVSDSEVLVWPWLKDGIDVPGAEFKIYSAQWGAYGFYDVTKKVQDLAVKPNTEFQAKDLTEFDPSPFAVKKLVVFYAYDHFFHMKVFREGQTVKLVEVLTVPQNKRSKWISKNATYTVSSKYAENEKVWEPRKSFLNGDAPEYSYNAEDAYSFATKTEKNPYAIVELDTIYRIDGFEIVNRKWSAKQDRAKTLTVWVSLSVNGPWLEIWRAEKAQAQWDVNLSKYYDARYVKIGLRETNELDLASIKLFGEESKGGNATKSEPGKFGDSTRQ